LNGDVEQLVKLYRRIERYMTIISGGPQFLKFDDVASNDFLSRNDTIPNAVLSSEEHQTMLQPQTERTEASLHKESIQKEEI